LADLDQSMASTKTETPIFLNPVTHLKNRRKEARAVQDDLIGLILAKKRHEE